MEQRFLTLLAELRNFQDPPELQFPASPEAVEHLIRAANEQLGYTPPPFYLDLLQVSDGLARNGIQLYGSHTAKIAGINTRESYLLGLVEANALWRTYEPNKEYIYLAETGGVLYCHNLIRDTFEIVDRITNEPDDEADIFATCQELLEKMLNHMLNRYEVG